MKVLGITKSETLLGKPLRNGGSAVMVDGNLTVALAEERATGEKHARGFAASSKRLLLNQYAGLEDFDQIAVSTCCEPEESALVGHPHSGDPRLVTVNHHLSHAAFAFYASGFEKALVIVADGGGNTLEGPPSREWWKQPREQHSYYLASKAGGIELIDRDFSDPLEVGFGEMYRAFTFFLGWHSSRYASKLMALAAHGQSGAFVENLFELSRGRLISRLQNDPDKPIDMIQRFSRAATLDFGEPRAPGEEILGIHKDIAAYVQEQLQLALVRKLLSLREAHRFENVCLAGGVALNVVANGWLAEKRICEGIYIPPAPGDEGQSIGNAIVAAARKTPRFAMTPITRSSQAALGPQVRIDSSVVSEALHKHGKANYTVFEAPNLPEIVAKLLSAGAIVMIFQIGSEVGPRALGHRSIISDPRNPEMRCLFNGLKEREWFMPFAPAVLRDHIKGWFEFDLASPFMSFAIKTRQSVRQLIPAVVSHDGTARLQSVEADEDSLLRHVLTAFHDRTGVPLVLNTSFNRGGRPIVESVDDAIETFASMAVNALVLGRFLIIKNLSPQLSEADLGVLPRNYDIPVVVAEGEERTRLQINDMPSRDIIRSVHGLTGMVVFVRHDFPLYGAYLDWLREGRKGTTIRFRKGGVEIPKMAELPLFETPDFGAAQREPVVAQREPVAAMVRIQSIRYQRFGQLTTEDANKDGFKSIDDMLTAFKQIYPSLRNEDWITKYVISPISRRS
jgi:carbamoyltransferase